MNCVCSECSGLRYSSSTCEKSKMSHEVTYGAKPLTLKLEAGKTYLSEKGYRYYVIGFSKNGQSVVTESTGGDVRETHYSNGKSIDFGSMSPLVKEYKEPVVHRRDVIWYRNGTDGDVYDITYPVGYTIPSHLIELKRQTVEYTEE